MHNAWIRPSLRDVLRRILFSPLAVLRFKACAWSMIFAARYVIVLEPPAVDNTALPGHLAINSDTKRKDCSNLLRSKSASSQTPARDGVNVLPWSRTYISEPAGYHLLPLNVLTSALNVYSCSPNDRVGIYTTSEFQQYSHPGLVPTCLARCLD